MSPAHAARTAIIVDGAGRHRAGATTPSRSPNEAQPPLRALFSELARARVASHLRDATRQVVPTTASGASREPFAGSWRPRRRRDRAGGFARRRRDVSRFHERGPVAGRDRLTIEEVVRRVLRDAPAGRAGEVGPQQQDGGRLARDRDHDRGPVAELHEAEQRGLLGDEQPDERAARDPDPPSAASAGTARPARPGSRPAGTSGPSTGPWRRSRRARRACRSSGSPRSGPRSSTPRGGRGRPEQRERPEDPEDPRPPSAHEPSFDLVAVRPEHVPLGAELVEALALTSPAR